MAGTNVSFDKFVERAYSGIPEQTSTIEDKERAIAAKKKILQHPDCPKESKSKLLQEISTIEGEIASIKDYNRMESMNSSIFPARNNLG